MSFSIGCAGRNVDAYSSRHRAVHHPDDLICIDDWTATLNLTTRWRYLFGDTLCARHSSVSCTGILAPSPANIIVPILGRYP
jgi:hypothetical protein